MTWPGNPIPVHGELDLSHVVPLPDGWLLAGGLSDSGAAFSDAGWIARTGPDGRRRWIHRSGSPSDHVQIAHVAPSDDGGAFVGGSRTQRAGESARGFLLELDGKGRERWSFEFGGLEVSGVDGLLPSPGGGAVYLRHEYLPTVAHPGRDDWSGHDFLVGVDAGGSELWRRELSAAFDRCSVEQLLPHPSGWAALVAASVWGEGAQDFPLLLTAQAELPQRQSAITEPKAAVGLGAAGSAILGGVSYTPWGKRDPVLLRLDAGGRPLWERHYGDPERDRPTCLASTPEGGFVLGGVRGFEGDHPPPQAVWLIQVDPAGERVYERVFDRGGRDRLAAVAVDAQGRVLAVGDDWTLSLDAAGEPDPWFRWRGVSLFDPTA